jgi:hypothetical protein
MFSVNGLLIHQQSTRNLSYCTHNSKRDGCVRSRDPARPGSLSAYHVFTSTLEAQRASVSRRHACCVVFAPATLRSSDVRRARLTIIRPARLGRLSLIALLIGWLWTALPPTGHPPSRPIDGPRLAMPGNRAPWPCHARAITALHASQDVGQGCPSRVCHARAIALDQRWSGLIWSVLEAHPLSPVRARHLRLPLVGAR